MTNDEPVDEMTKGHGLAPLLPDRHPQMDFFVCDIFDAAPKSDVASMTFPLFTLATKPDHISRRYEQGSYWIEINPGAAGRATVHDRDVLIYCISQCMAALRQGRQINRTMRLHAHDLLQVTNRQTSGAGYEGLTAALKRLQSTQIVTNVTTGGIEQMDVFSFVDRVRTIKETREGRMIELEITLSDWVFNAIREKEGEILTIHRDYFRLRKPLERRLYELARKHCGRNKEWKFSLSTLRERTGSNSTPKEFARLVRGIVADNEAHRHIPDYDFALNDNETLTITPRLEFLDSCAPHAAESVRDALAPLRPATYERAKKIAPRADIYELEAQWRDLMASRSEPVRSPDAAFIGFVRNWSIGHSGDP